MRTPCSLCVDHGECYLGRDLENYDSGPPPPFHVYVAEEVWRELRRCPYHETPEWANVHDYYDTRRYFFDCGAFIDAGYGYWSKPKSVLKAERHEAYLRRKARKLAAAS